MPISAARLMRSSRVSPSSSASLYALITFAMPVPLSRRRRSRAWCAVSARVRRRGRSLARALLLLDRELTGARLHARRALFRDARDRDEQVRLRLGQLLEARHAMVEQELRLVVAHAVHRRECRRELGLDGAHVGLALDVDLPARELDGEPDVLALLADRE